MASIIQAELPKRHRLSVAYPNIIPDNYSVRVPLKPPLSFLFSTYINSENVTRNFPSKVLVLHIASTFEGKQFIFRHFHREFII